MRVILKAALVCAGLALAAPPASARDFDVYGTNDGQRARDECPPGEYFVGVVGSAGLWLDQITVACAKPKSDQTFSGPKTLPSRGGGGGKFKQVYCPADAAVTSISIKRSPDYKIVGVDLTCKSVKTWQPKDISFKGTKGSFQESGEHNCLAGELATGLTIRFGEYVNGLGLICGAYSGAPAAACASGRVWRESFEGDALCVKLDERFRKADGICRSGYVWRDLFNGDGVCVTPKEKNKAWAAAGKPLPGSKGSDGGFVKMIPTTPDKVAEKFVTVDQEVDIYRAPGGNEADKTGETLKKGTQSVKLVEKQAPWYHVNWPAGDGWVYSGEGYVSLTLP